MHPGLMSALSLLLCLNQVTLGHVGQQGRRGGHDALGERWSPHRRVRRAPDELPGIGALLQEGCRHMVQLPLD